VTRRRSQAGFTLIELMVALLISTLVVILTLAIFMRMSFAYREQSQIVNVQQSLAAAKRAIEMDGKQAGFAITDGFRIAGDGSLTGSNLKHSPVVVVNSATGPDEIGFYYADASKQAIAAATLPAPDTSFPLVTVQFDDPSQFVADELVVLATPSFTTNNPIDPINDAKLARFDACVLQINTVAAPNVTFHVSGSWGTATNDHCSAVVQNATMMYKFVARYWRIDPARESEGVLQLSTVGNLVGGVAWNDMAYGFTDLQVATYYYDGDATNVDGLDTDVRDWYSGEEQETKTAPIVKTASFEPPLLATISLVARTDREVEGVYTTATPQLSGTTGTGPSNNTLGDRASVTLPSSTDLRLGGRRLYRYLTFQVDMRNLGVGQ
jgi:prepilin-type N-terminal cleavage/methylation domain-containing protein